MNRHVKWGVALLLSLALGVAGLLLSGGRIDQVAQVRVSFKEINDFAVSETGSRYVVDSFRSRLITTDANGRFRSVLDAMAGATFTDIAVSGEEAYLLERDDQGDTLVTIGADGKTVRKRLAGEAIGLVSTEEGIGLVYRMQDGWRWKPSVLENTVLVIDMPEDTPWHVTGGPDGSLYALAYSGRIWRIDGESRTVFDPKDANWQELCIPGDVAVDEQGRIWIANLGSRRVGYIENGAFVPVLSAQDVIDQGFADVDNSGVYLVSIAGDQIVSANGSRLLIRSDTGQISGMNSAAYGPAALAARALALLGALGAAICVVRFVVIGIVALFRARMSALTGQAFQFVIFVLIFGVSVGANLIVNYQKQYDLSKESWVRQTALLSAVDIAQKGYLETPSLSAAQQQRALHDLLAEVSASTDGEMELSLVVPSEDAVRVLAQTVSQVPMYYPLKTDLISEDASSGLSYSAAMQRAVMMNGIVVDQRGRWETCLCPVFGRDGTPVALVDARIDADAFRRENQQLFIELILSASSVVVVVLFLLIEINRLMAVQMEPPAKGVPLAQHKRSLVRWLGFLAFTALNIPMFFIPVQAAVIYQAGAPDFLTKDIAIAAPLTVNMLAMAISSTALASWVERRGWKAGTVLGIIICAGGYALAMLVENILWYIGMIFVAGLGVGLISVGLQTYIFASAPPEDTESDRLLSMLNSGMYAGANCGVIFGSLLADRIGYFGAFMAAVAVFALALACVWKMLPNASIQQPSADEEGGKPMSFARFLLNGRVLSFLLLMLVPATVLGFFVAHFLPIYADQNGLSSTLASWGYLLNGIAIIYLGPVFTRLLLSRFGGRTAVLITAGIALAGIALFAAMPAIATAFACSMLLGLADAGGQVSRQEAFLQLPQSRRAGGTRALSVYSLFENIGSTIGPGLFSLVLAVGVQPGSLAMLVIVAACFGLYAFTSIERGRAARIKKEIAG